MVSRLEVPVDDEQTSFEYICRKLRLVMMKEINNNEEQQLNKSHYVPSEPFSAHVNKPPSAAAQAL